MASLPFRTLCGFSGCQTPMISTCDSWCGWCRNVFCSDHNGMPTHDCSLTPESTGQEILAVTRKIERARLANLLLWISPVQSAIIASAKALRTGHDCELRLPKEPESTLEADMGGGVNYHFPVIFDDGDKWLLRARQMPEGPVPPDYQEQIIKSEVATLQHFHRKGLPVPNAWVDDGQIFHPIESGHSPHLSYFFCEYLNGKPNLDLCYVNDSIHSPGTRTRNLIEQFAAFQIELHGLPIHTTQIGSLTYSPAHQNEPAVGPLIALGCLHHIDTPYILGPFNTNQDRYLGQIDIALQHIINGYICMSDPLDAYLWHLQLRELVAGSVELAQPISRGYITHADAKGDHILVDENDKISGVIDWECAYVTTEEEAFAAPRWLFALQEDEMEITAAEEILAKSYEKLGRPNLACHVRNGKLYQRLAEIGMEPDDPLAQIEILQVFRHAIPPDFRPPYLIGYDWRVYSINRYRGDVGLQQIMIKVGWDGTKEYHKNKEGLFERDEKVKEFWDMTFERFVELKQQLRREFGDTESSVESYDLDNSFDDEPLVDGGSDTDVEPGEVPEMNPLKTYQAQGQVSVVIN